MRCLLFIFTIAGACFAPVVTHADNGGSFDYDIQISFERASLEGVTLGDEPTEDRIVEEESELEFVLDYQVNDQFYLFFSGAFIDETETVETLGQDEHLSGLERKELGLGYYFGNSIESELIIGRSEFESESEWWLWWDEELDGIRLNSEYQNFALMLGLAEEQARESTAVDFIDPEQDKVQRTLLSLQWDLYDGHSLVAYTLEQSDDSESFNIGEFEDFEKADESDADLNWIGISYFGEVEFESMGMLEIEWHSARVSGDETLYEFDDPSAGLSEIVEKTQGRVSGSSQGLKLSFTAEALDNWTFILGRASGSGDSNPDDSRDKSFRQTGLQGDGDPFGALYQPELSNIEINQFGFEWNITGEVNIAVTRFDYRQRNLAEEMREVNIENDLTGTSRDLGHEIDLVVTIETEKNLELIFTMAEFNPGDAYGALSDETSNYINFEVVYEF